MRPPDRLAAEARRWVERIGYGTEPAVIAAVLHALRHYYADLVVVEGIVRFRLGAKS